MRKWNLSSFEQLGTTVLTAQPSFASQRRDVGLRRCALSPFNIAMRVVALAAASYSLCVCGSAVLPGVDGVQITCNVDEGRSPLEALFASRFDGRWTREQEDQLLSEALKKPVVSDRDRFNLVHTAQHETVSGDAPRLSEEEILKLTRRKV